MHRIDNHLCFLNLSDESIILFYIQYLNDFRMKNDESFIDR